MRVKVGMVAGALALAVAVGCAPPVGDQRLGDLGGPESCAHDIDATGTIVGASDTLPLPTRDPAQKKRAFRRAPDGRMDELVPLPGDDHSVASHFAPDGSVLGTSYRLKDDGASAQTLDAAHAVRWRADGTVVDLGVPGIALAESSSGIVTGNSSYTFPAGMGQAWVRFPDGEQRQLAVPGRYGTALPASVDDDGTVWGTAWVEPTPLGSAWHAARWGAGDQAFEDLSPSGSTSSAIDGTGPDGTRVGWYHTGGTTGSTMHLAVWPVGRGAPLEVATVAPSPGVLFAFDREADGTIVGSYLSGVTPKAFVIRPGDTALREVADQPDAVTEAFAGDPRRGIVGCQLIDGSLRAMRFDEAVPAPG